MSDWLGIAAICAFIFLGIVGIQTMLNQPADSIPPTDAFSRVIAHSGFYDAKNYNDVLRMDFPYAQISDLTTQNCISGSAKNVTLNTNDSIYQITHSTTSSTNQIKIQKPGVYQVIAVPQVGEASGQASGEHDFWMLRNNVAVPNSNVKTTVMLQASGSETMTATINWVGYLNRDDIISFQQSCTDSDIGIIFTAAAVATATPSVIISIAKISY